MKKIVFFLLLTISACAHSQTVTGYWYGKANVANGASTNNYLVEVILKQNQTAVTGVLNYYFKNTFRSVQLNGNYNSLNRQLTLFNIPVTYYASTANVEVDCMMDFLATLRVAQAGSNLSGNFVGKGNYKHTCPDITFDLQLNKDAGNQDSILTALRQFKETYQVWSPSAADTLVAATIITRPVVNYVVAREYKERENVVAKEITIDADSVSVDFYDNGEVDGDSISVFYNGQLIAFNRMLSTRSVHFTFALDSTKEYNEITMFADNLGSIPPNTALMIVSDGKKRYEVRLTSDLQKNATLRIRRKTSP
jgi:hypothetical protein